MVIIRRHYGKQDEVFIGMSIKFKNGSEITTIDATDGIRSKVKFIWEWNEETQEYEQHVIEPGSMVDKYLKLRDYYKHRPDKFIAEVFDMKLKWYQKIWLRITNFRKEM